MNGVDNQKVVVCVDYNEKANHPADVAELADALDSGSSKGNLVEVQVLSSAPKQTKEFISGPPISRRLFNSGDLTTL